MRAERRVERSWGEGELGGGLAEALRCVVWTGGWREVVRACGVVAAILARYVHQQRSQKGKATKSQRDSQDGGRRAPEATCCMTECALGETVDRRGRGGEVRWATQYLLHLSLDRKRDEADRTRTPLQGEGALLPPCENEVQAVRHQARQNHAQRRTP